MKLSFPEFQNFDENVFNVLLPHKDAWRDAEVVTPSYFVSPSIFERAFSELFSCTAMYVDSYVHDQLSQPFVLLPAVRECTSLTIAGNPTSPITVAEIVEWLNLEARSKEPKWYETRGNDDFVDSVDDLLQHLKTVSVATIENQFFSTG